MCQSKEYICQLFRRFAPLAILWENISMHAKELGTLGELKFVTEALLHGYTVLKPFTDVRRYDFVLEKDGRFIKVQVKSNFAPPNSKESFRFRVSRGVNKKSNYEIHEIDFFAFYLDYNRSFYLIPCAFFKAAKSVTVYPKGKKNIFEQFKENWNL